MSPDLKSVTWSRPVTPTGANYSEARSDVGLLMSASEYLFANGRSEQPIRVSDPLTVREREVLGMIGQGLTNKRIGRILEVSPETVKSHVKRIFLKMAVSTRAEAVFRAGSLGLL